MKVDKVEIEECRGGFILRNWIGGSANVPMVVTTETELALELAQLGVVSGIGASPSPVGGSNPAPIPSDLIAKISRAADLYDDAAMIAKGDRLVLANGAEEFVRRVRAALDESGIPRVSPPVVSSPPIPPKIEAPKPEPVAHLLGRVRGLLESEGEGVAMAELRRGLEARDGKP